MILTILGILLCLWGGYIAGSIIYGYGFGKGYLKGSQDARNKEDIPSRVHLS